MGTDKLYHEYHAELKWAWISPRSENKRSSSNQVAAIAAVDQPAACSAIWKNQSEKPELHIGRKTCLQIPATFRDGHYMFLNNFNYSFSLQTVRKIRTLNETRSCGGKKGKLGYPVSVEAGHVANGNRSPRGMTPECKTL